MWDQNFSIELKQKISETEKLIAPKIQEIQNIVLENQAKVLTAFRKNQVSSAHFAGTNGYGYDDQGRDILDQVYADVFEVEKAIVRPQLVSGTHAIGTAVLGNLKPGDQLVYLTGTPYDTLQEVIGIAGSGAGSLLEMGVNYDEVALTLEGNVDYKGLKQKITPATTMVAIQRSRGYSSRASFTIADIQKMISAIKEQNSKAIIFVDNCYGEFSETIEPTQIGADLIAGSLIKNPGGGLAKTGGYVAGRADLVERAGYRMTVPGIGAEEGATLNNLQDFFQGFFMAPHLVGEAIKGAIYTAALFEKEGLVTAPKWDSPRTDLIQTVDFGEVNPMVNFAKVIQKYSPIDSSFMPEPSLMAGYEDEIIMAAGTFVQGATSELSADGPLRAPYTLYLQGGLSYEHVKIAVTSALNEVYYTV